MTKKITQILSGALLFLPFIASAQDATAFDAIINAVLITTSSYIFPLLFVLATLIFLFGVVTYIAKADDDAARKKAKNLMLWGIIGLAVITAAWSIAGLLVRYFGVGGGGIPSNYGIPLL